MNNAHRILAAAALVLSVEAPANSKTPVPTDLKLLCDQAAEATQDYWTPWDTSLRSIIANGTRSEIFQALGKYSDPAYSQYQVTPWILGTSNRREAREVAYSYQMLHAETWVGIKDETGAEPPMKFPQLKAYLEAKAAHSTVYSSAVKTDVEAAITKMWPDNNLKRLEKLSGAICRTYTVDGCAKAFVDTLRTMSPRHGKGAIFSILDTTTELFEDPSYIRPLSIAALKMMKRVEDAAGGRPLAPAKLFTDMESSFEEAGYTASVATEMTWKALAFYSTRGASMDGVLREGVSDRENLPVFIPLFVISSAMNLLDLDYANQDGFYSYPEQLKTTCLYGKPYHFWNAAYLARRAMKNGNSSEAAALGVFLPGELYEIFDRTTGRTPGFVLSTPQFSNYNNSIRLNLLFNTAGAAYGVDPERALDGDAALHRMLEASVSERRPLAWVAFINKLRFYHLWRKVIAPDTLLESFKD